MKFFNTLVMSAGLFFSASSALSQTDELVFKSIESLKMDNHEETGRPVLFIKGIDTNGDHNEYGTVSDLEILEACQRFAMKVMELPDRFDLRVYKGNEYFCELIAE